MTSDGEPYNRVRYKNIIKEQVILGYLTKGGVSYQDSELMTPYEREIALNAITEILDSQNRKLKESQGSPSNTTINDPKTGLTSGVGRRK